MRVSIIVAIALAVLIDLAAMPARSSTYVYDAVCDQPATKDKQEAANETRLLTACDSVVLGVYDNGSVLIQFSIKASTAAPLGFAGNELDHETNVDFVTLPVRRLYLPHAKNPGVPEVVDGVAGYCFFKGGMNIRSMQDVACSTSFEIEHQSIVYEVHARITSPGRLTPAP